MAYADCVIALTKTLKGVRGLRQVLDYEPQAIEQVPSALILLDRFRHSKVSDVVIDEWYVTVRAVVALVDNEMAEKQMRPFVNSIPHVIDADPYLGGWLAGDGVTGSGGMMRVPADTDAPTVVLKYGTTFYKGVDIPIVIKEITSAS